jgi:hypothetical protein
MPASAVAPHPEFLLVGNIGAVASLIQRPRNGVFGIVVDYGYIPAGAGHASGAVNAFSRWRRQIIFLPVSHLQNGCNSSRISTNPSDPRRS